MNASLAWQDVWEYWDHAVLTQAIFEILKTLTDWPYIFVDVVIDLHSVNMMLLHVFDDISDITMSSDELNTCYKLCCVSICWWVLCVLFFLLYFWASRWNVSCILIANIACLMQCWQILEFQLLYWHKVASVAFSYRYWLKWTSIGSHWFLYTVHVLIRWSTLVLASSCKCSNANVKQWQRFFNFDITSLIVTFSCMSLM